MVKSRQHLPDPMRSGLLSALALLLISISLATSADEPAIHIDAERGGLDIRTGVYELFDNVVITRGELIVRADRARSFSDAQGDIERIELYGSPVTWRDVSDDGDEVHGQSEELIYDFVQNRITMNVDARIRNAQGAFSGASLVYDLDTQNLVGDGGVNLVIQPGAGTRNRSGQRDRDVEPEGN